MPRHPAFVIGLVVLWIVSVFLGLRLLDYRVPGARAEAARYWPRASQLPHDEAHFTLVLFLHPHCPCSDVTLDSFADLAQQCGPRVEAVVAFVVPPGAAAGWERTSLFRRATSLENVRTSIDRDGVEAGRFGAMTSGHVVLYAPDGHLAFQGGIAQRGGHHQDSPGRQAILACLTEENSTAAETAIFGCALLDRKCCRAEDSGCKTP